MQAVSAQETGAGTSIRERMRMLQLDQVARNAPQPPQPPTAPGSTPRLPPRPPGNNSAPAATPAANKPAPPPLPQRKTSRSSLAESVASVASTSSNNSLGSAASTRSLPPVYTGKESLPVQLPRNKKPTVLPLPTKRVNGLPPPRPAPPLPTRRPAPVVGQENSRWNSGEETAVIPRRLPQTPTRSATTPVTPQRPALQASRTDPTVVVVGPPPIPRSTRPPPVPVSSRPSLSSSSCAPHAASPLPCLVCYDFSGPDHHSSLPQFRRSRVHSLRDLAIALTSPFPSALEKARVIFTWLHHNISYDVHSFLTGNIPAQNPEPTLRTGLAVCAGYAGLYEVLALHSGLECVVVAGHGKGYSHSDRPGPPPPFNTNHAWNAVKLAPNYWHLIDSCWGAGHITGPPTPGYHAKLNPGCFTSPPSVFGRKHYPENHAMQHREDGRVVSWEEYMAPETAGPQYYAQFSELFNFSKETTVPATKYIQGGTRVRFAVTLPCQHLPAIRAEDEYVLFLNVGKEFNVKNFYLMEPDGTGRGYECTVMLSREQGLKVTLYYPTEFDGRSGKGLGREYFLKRVGKCGWGWGQVIQWEGE